MSWQKVKLKEVLKQYRVQHIVQDDNEYKQVSILNDGSVVLRGSKIGKEIGRKRQFIIDLNTYPETLIFTRQLLLQGSIGIASEDVNDCIVTENMPMFSIKTSKIDKDFLILFLKSEVFKSRIRKIELSGSAQKSIHEKTFLDLEFHIPKIEEQKEIVVELLKLKSNSNSISTEIINQLDLIKQLRQAFLREAMQGKLVKSTNTKETGQQLLEKIKAEKAQLIAEKKLKKEKELPPISEDEIPFEIPEHWAWCRLGEICTKVTDGFHNTPKKLQEGKIYISATHVKDTGIKWDECLYVSEKDHLELFKKASPKKGEILITNRGAGCGTPAIIDIEDEFSFQNTALIGFSQSLINNKYVYNFILKSRDEIMAKFVNGGLQPMLSNVILKTVPFPLPPLHEQEQIVAKLEELMAFCDGLEQSIKESQGYNEMLLQQVLREALQGEKNKYNIII
jgi:type I restriction enzyme S subunit